MYPITQTGAVVCVCKACAGGGDTETGRSPELAEQSVSPNKPSERPYLRNTVESQRDATKLDELSSNLTTHGKVKGENQVHKIYLDHHSHVHTCTHTCEHTLTVVVVVVINRMK